MALDSVLYSLRSIFSPKTRVPHHRVASSVSVRFQRSFGSEKMAPARWLADRLARPPCRRSIPPARVADRIEEGVDRRRRKSPRGASMRYVAPVPLRLMPTRLLGVASPSVNLAASKNRMIGPFVSGSVGGLAERSPILTDTSASVAFSCNSSQPRIN